MKNSLRRRLLWQNYALRYRLGGRIASSTPPRRYAVAKNRIDAAAESPNTGPDPCHARSVASGAVRHRAEEDGYEYRRVLNDPTGEKMYVTKNLQEKYVFARVMRETKMHSQYFTLKQHETWEQAEEAAQKWIAELLPTLPAKMSSEGRMTRRNHSGEVGVYRSKGIVRKRNGREYECPRWVARWVGCPLRGGLSWSIIQFDEDGAYVLAVLARRQRSVNRDALLTHFDSILGRKEYKEVLAQRENRLHERKDT